MRVIAIFSHHVDEKTAPGLTMARSQSLFPSVSKLVPERSLKPVTLLPNITSRASEWPAIFRLWQAASVSSR